MAKTHAELNAGSTSKCTACGEYFSGESSFDKHRVGVGNRRHCRNPEDVGLVINTRGNGTVWGYPSPNKAAFA